MPNATRKTASPTKPAKKAKASPAGKRAAAAPPDLPLFPGYPDAAGDGAEVGRMSLADRATVILRRAILDLRIEPNARLDERYLQETFEISRTPAREAMNRLLAEGFLEAKPGFGVCARALDLGEINSFFDAYFAEEKMIAYFCRLDDEGFVEDLIAINKRLVAAQKEVSVQGVQIHNRDFHVRIARACHNFHIQRFAEQMHDHAQRLTSLAYRLEARMYRDVQAEQAKVDDFHNAIIDHIRHKRREALSQVMTDHAQQFHDRVCSIITFNRGPQFNL